MDRVARVDSAMVVVVFVVHNGSSLESAEDKPQGISTRRKDAEGAMTVRDAGPNQNTYVRNAADAPGGTVKLSRGHPNAHFDIF